MKVSRIFKNNLETDSQSFKDLSPVMKEAVRDVFKLIEKETGDIITKFDNAVTKVAEFHNINLKKFDEYFDNEILEQLGEK
jgi:hypothetical protein